MLNACNTIYSVAATSKQLETPFRNLTKTMRKLFKKFNRNKPMSPGQLLQRCIKDSAQTR